jgi:uncharacterized protein involved in type VI secretion and phage assembly
MAEDDTSTKTFTQAEVDAIVRDRLKRERDATATKYADYDDLKARAAEADKSKTQLDKVQEQLDTMAKRAANSERQSTIREVADELGISVKQASRLKGESKDELLADGREFLEDFAPNRSGEGDTKGNDNQGDRTPPARESAPTRGRPRESLRPGTPMTEAKPEETNPLKLAEAIPRY